MGCLLFSAADWGGGALLQDAVDLFSDDEGVFVALLVDGLLELLLELLQRVHREAGGDFSVEGLEDAYFGGLFEGFFLTGLVEDLLDGGEAFLDLSQCLAE